MRRARNSPGAHPPHLLELGHQVVLRVQPTGGVDQHHVEPAPDRAGESIVDHRRRIGAGSGAQDLRSRALGPHFELLDRGGAERVGGHEQRAAALAREPGGELAGERGLTDTVDPDEQRHPGPCRGIRPARRIRLEAGAGGGQHLGRGAAECFAQVQRGLALHALLGAPDQAIGGIRTHIGCEQRLFEPRARPGVHGVQAEQPADPGAKTAAGARQPRAEAIPETHRSILIG